MKNKKFFSYEDDVYTLLRKAYLAEKNAEKEVYLSEAHEIIKRLKKKSDENHEQSIKELKKAVKIFEK